MKELSRIHSAVQASATLAVNSKFKQMKAEGIPVVGFGAGEPDFDTPDHIKDAAIRAIREGKTKYTPTSGTITLRKAISFRMKEDLDIDFEYDSIVVSNGAKACLYAAMMALLDPGDEIILPAPYWVSYAEMIRMCGGVPVIVNTTEAQSFKITPRQLEDAVTDRTKAIIINNPSNPTGMIYNAAELRALADVCLKNDLYIIADEIYYRLCYDGKTFTSIASLGEDVREHCIVINGVSKSYSMTGWRCGFAACGDKRVTTVMANCLSHAMGCIGAMNQEAMQEALLGPQDSVDEMRKVFEERRDYIVERMNSIEGVSCLKPDGAFYAMMNIEKLIGRDLGGRTIRDADDFSMAFLEKGLVAVVSCCAFGAPNYVRWTYATSMETIREGLDRLEKFLKDPG